MPRGRFLSHQAGEKPAARCDGLRTAKMKLVQAWIEIHQEELMKDWHLAVNGQAIFRIEPLR
jgi:hypothetical protein